MIVRSTVEVTIQRDRISQRTGLIEIEIKQIDKDDISQVYTFKTSDVLISNSGLETEERTPIIQMETGLQEKKYTKTYAEYDAQKAQLSQLFPTELAGSEADDYWLQMGLLYNLMIDPIYGLAVSIDFETGVITGDWTAVNN